MPAVDQARLAVRRARHHARRLAGGRIRDRTDLLNALIREHRYGRYLEIGVRDPFSNFVLIDAAVKHGVDPDPRGPVDFRMTSDEFFAELPSTTTYDLIFIDGLHLAEQVDRDVNNALAHLDRAGRIVLHDCNPATAEAQVDRYDGVSQWNGTVWKAWAKLRATRPDLTMFVADIDEGCGVIGWGSQELFPLPTVAFDEMTFAMLDAGRRELLNLVPADQLRTHL